jgi:hypothetical protein
MTQSLVVNGKEYLPCSELATRFSYTPDYIGKLAREEKILGTLIGRVWFIEPESLKTFLAQAEVEKKLRADDLRIQRKLEREVHAKSQHQKIRSHREHELVAAAQAAVVLLCGGLLGTLGFASTEARLGMQEFAQGIESSVVVVVSSIIPQSSVDSFASAPQAAASAEVVRYHADSLPEDELVFTSLPEFPVREPITAASSTLSVLKASLDFSDEVKIVTQEDGSQVITPVFRKGEGEEYLLIPVNAGTE